MLKKTKDFVKKISLSTKSIDEKIWISLAEAIFENVKNIKSIHPKYLKEIADKVLLSIKEGNGQADLVPYFQTFDGISIESAYQFSLEQTLLAYSDLHAIRMASTGLKKYEWLYVCACSIGQEDHAALDGKIFEFSDDPIIDQKTKRKGKPGSIPGCCCRMVAAISF